MDSLTDLLPDLGEGAQFYMTAVGVALVVSVLVGIIKSLAFKPEQKTAYWYRGAVMGIGSILGIAISLVALFANGIALTGQTIALAALAGILYGAAASGGYQWFKGLREFVGGALAARRVMNVGGDLVEGNKTTGDDIDIETIEGVEGAAIGAESNAEINKQ